MDLSGSPKFIENLLKCPFPSANDIVTIMDGCDVNGHRLSETGFLKPIVVPRKEGLRIQVPPITFSPRDLLLHVDPSLIVDVIDVRNQCEIQMQLSDYISHFTAKNRKMLLNMISLEFSRSRLAKYVQPPHVVSELSLVTKCWIHDSASDLDVPHSDDNLSHEFVLPTSAPTVQKYCLLSMQGSYTDFHIDFGGSSVWYHVLWGEKIFYLIPPTPDHFSAYWIWSRSPNHREVFFPDMLSSKYDPSCRDRHPVYSLHIQPGETVLLPSGWIHAVYTISDCLVFGGNFLCEIHIPMQLSVYRQEEKSNVLEKFRFPNFEKIHWFVAGNLIGRLTNALYDGFDAKPYELIAASHLSKVLRRWYEKRRTLPVAERGYYLPSRSTLELSWPDLVQRLSDLVQAFKPFQSQYTQQTASNSAGKPGSHQSSRRTDIKTPDSSSHRSMSSKKARSAPKDEDQLPMINSADRQLKKRSARSFGSTSHRDLGTCPSADTLQDEEAMSAIPELAKSRMVGDHYFLDLGESDDEDSGGDLDPNFGHHFHHTSSKKVRDEDPTWAESAEKRKKASGRGKRPLLTSPAKSVIAVPKAARLGSGVGDSVHPLLQVEATSKSSLKPGTSGISAPVPGRGTSAAGSEGKKKSSGSTVRQRLAKRLGLS